MGRSRKLTLTDWTAANNALMLYFEGNKSKLAKHAKVSRTTVTDFFKERPVGESSFRKICLALRLNVQIISADTLCPDSSNNQPSGSTQQQVIQQLDREEDNSGNSKLEAANLSHSSNVQDICHNLPQPNYGKFIGREQELTKIFDKLRPYPYSQIAVITIDGIGGIGKSALALEVAHRFLQNHEKILGEERFEAIVWCSAKQTVLRPDKGIVHLERSFQTLEEICRAIAFTLGIEEQVYSRKSEIFDFICRALTKKRTLLIIDNLETVNDEAVMEFLKDWLPAPTKAIVTTRHRIDVAYPIRLVGMNWEDSQQLIDQGCQEKNIKINLSRRERLYKRTGGVPLALVWTIAKVGLGHKIDSILANLGQHQNDLVHFCFNEVVTQIRNRDSYKVLLALVICEGETDRGNLQYVSGFEGDEFSFDEGLVELEVLSLITRKTETITMLPLTKAYVVHELRLNPHFERESLKRQLNWTSSSNELRINSLRAYSRSTILREYSQMRLPNGEEIDVDQLYVDVWLLERPESRYFNSPASLLRNFDISSDRLALGKRIQRNPGLEIAQSNAKLIILGKPGSGKTTFLKNLAICWCKEKFQSEKIAVFLELRKIQQETWNLVDAISQKLASNKREVLNLLKQGNLLVLMDGLDEVPTAELRHNVQTQIQQILQQYSKQNRFILTCRTQVIGTIPSGFVSVEVADFNVEQVRQFVQNWFIASGRSKSETTQAWKSFKLAMANQPDLAEMMMTPVLLSLVCVVWQDHGEIPTNRTNLYKIGIHWLLRRWNENKEIEGWDVGTVAYRQLSIEDKEALLMEIAAYKFNNPNNFILSDQDTLAAQIAQNLHLPSIEEGISVLKSIETQHGLLIERADELWSFSNLSFQEYFTVQWLIQLTPQQLMEKISKPNWRLVIRQLVQSQQPADRLLRLIKKAIDQSLIQESAIQSFLNWLSLKSDALPTIEKMKLLNIGQDWQLTQDQKLKRYQESNNFLIDLLDIEGAVSESCRAEIEDGLLLPWAELQRRQPHLYGDLDEF